jgi:hypothetical protein
LKTALLWNTYRGDLPWFEISARSYKKFARGWDVAKCIVPNRDFDLFLPACRANDIALCSFDEWPDKGFNHHQAMQCYGDHHFPSADVIFHIDADCIFAQDCSPSDWILHDKILLPFCDFEHYLTDPIKPGEEMNFMGFRGTCSDFSRGQYFWKFAADFACGWPVVRETMQWMPIAHHRDVYAKTRQVIESRHGVPFEDYVKSCRNEFPQSFAEFNILGAIAHKFFQDRYRWQDIHAHKHLFWGKVLQSHSHSGFDKPHDYGIGCGQETPRQLFTRLGLL